MHAPTISGRLLIALSMLLLATPVFADETSETLPDPDGKPADMSKPVQIYMLLGQSNMVGAGRVGGGDGSLEYAVKEKDLYPYLVDDSGAWTERKDVRFARVMATGGNVTDKPLNNQWLTVSGINKIGPELGIGHQLGHAVDAPVLILKSCIGNRGIGYSLLPPGSERYEFEDKGKTMIHAGFGDTGSWEKGAEPPPKGWYAGCQYDSDIGSAKKVLENLKQWYPEAEKYEVAGFYFWQGDKDRYSENYAKRYEQNLVQLIKALRKDFDAPEAPFVLATLGQSKKDEAKGNDALIFSAQLAVDGNSGKYPEFKGNVATVYTHPLSKGGASNSHYGGNAETYMNVGEAMGKAMVKLLETEE